MSSFDTQSLLGLSSCQDLTIIKRVDTINSNNISSEWQKKFPSVFQGLGTMPGEYNIKLKPDAKPFSINVSRRVPLPMLSKVTAELERMVGQDVIAPISEPTEWCAGMVVVHKANNSIRICTDFRNLNEAVIRERFTLPSVDETLAKLGNAKVFSKLDANSGFWQVRLSEESARLTTFITPIGRYYYKRLPFGINSAPEHFSKKMHDLLGSVPGILLLMDDILIYASDKREHDEILYKVLTILADNGVTLNSSKCQFETKTISYLGHMITPQGIAPDPSKVDAIAQYPEPTTLRVYGDS